MDEYKCKHPRRPFAATVEIQVGADAISGATRDISTTELYIESLVMPPLDTPCQVHIVLANGEVTHTIKDEGKMPPLSKTPNARA